MIGQYTEEIDKYLAVVHKTLQRQQGRTFWANKIIAPRYFAASTEASAKLPTRVQLSVVQQTFGQTHRFMRVINSCVNNGNFCAFTLDTQFMEPADSGPLVDREIPAFVVYAWSIEGK